MRSALLLAAVWAALCTGCGADVPETGREGEPVTVTVLNPDYSTPPLALLPTSA